MPSPSVSDASSLQNISIRNSIIKKPSPVLAGGRILVNVAPDGICSGVKPGCRCCNCRCLNDKIDCDWHRFVRTVLALRTDALPSPAWQVPQLVATNTGPETRGRREKNVLIKRNVAPDKNAVFSLRKTIYGAIGNSWAGGAAGSSNTQPTIKHQLSIPKTVLHRMGQQN